jgi:hypothetical protein
VQRVRRTVEAIVGPFHLFASTIAMTGSEPRRAGCPAAGVPRVETTVDCGVPPPPTPPGFAPLPNSPNFIADSTTCPVTKSPGFPGRIDILQPTDHPASLRFRSM